MNNQYSDEIDLKQLGKRVFKISKDKKKPFTLIFLFLFLIAMYFFISEVFKPSYKAEFILKTKVVKKDQLEKVIEKYNSSILNTQLNPINNEISNFLKSSNIFLLSVKENEVDSKDKGESYRFYTYRVFFSSLPKEETINNLDLLLKDIQSNCSKDNEIIQNKILIQNEIIQMDSLINVAFSVGNTYKQKLENGTNNQLLVMNDLYKGINELSNQKANLQNSLAMLQPENIIFQTSPSILSQKTKYPTIFFLFSIVAWIVICGFWICGEIIFGDY